MTLRKDILEFSSNGFVKHVIRMIHLHGSHVVIKSVLDWDLAADFMVKFLLSQNVDVGLLIQT